MSKKVTRRFRLLREKKEAKKAAAQPQSQPQANPDAEKKIDNFSAQEVSVGHLPEWQATKDSLFFQILGILIWFFIAGSAIYFFFKFVLEKVFG
jgi:hypothetical protein